MNILNRIFLSVVLIIASQTSYAEPEVSAEIGRFYYEIGGGKVLPPPGSGIYTFNIRSSFNAGYGYSCGGFNYHSNLTQIINQWEDQIRQIPGQLMDAFSGAVAGLPMYVLMKANASLYNTINVTLGETTELFRLSYNSCKQIENELRQNPDSNPYQGFIRASILDKWHFGMENDENIADTDQRIKEDPVDPILWFGGNRAGTVENPIQINRDLVIAGYNIMIGRTGDVSVVTAPTGAAAEQPIVRIWPNPAEAGRWIQEVIGDQILILENPPPHPETIPGKGLRPIVTALEPEIHEALMEVFSHNNYDLMNNYLSLPSISGKLADGLRTLPRHEVLVFMDRLVSEMAVKEVQERLFLIRQMIYTALKAPDLLATPEAGREAQNYAQDKTFPGIRDTLEEVFNDLELRQRTLNPTMLTIFDRAEAFRKSGQSKQSVSTHREQRVE